MSSRIKIINNSSARDFIQGNFAESINIDPERNRVEAITLIVLPLSLRKNAASFSFLSPM
jgi:hypothetical protein